MKRVMKSASDCIQTVGLMYDKFDRIIYVKDSPLLKYSKKWIEINCGKTEEEIRNSMTNVDGYDVTIHDLLFEEVEDYVATWAMTIENKDDSLNTIVDLCFDFDGWYDREMILENFEKDKLIRIIGDLADLIDEVVDIAKIGLGRNK
jgi:phosphosulfolactate synthase (CoM biosynthesis protein A)